MNRATHRAVRGSDGVVERTIGVISDTHGLIRPEAIEALRGSEHIIHAGDMGDPSILERLRELAPVTAVRGNVDGGDWARRIPRTNVVEIRGFTIYVLHNLDELDLNPESAGLSAVVYGHSHIPRQEFTNGVLYFNPGSAGPRRFQLPISVGKLWVDEAKLRAEILELAVTTPVGSHTRR
ncbi:MAG TPA: metallophosphoesterase family protein [Terriglobales bacterium]|nr:metallophosphoesterase family protein [Terriglobales bacterium]